MTGMANKAVPMIIGRTVLHEKARVRTHKLFADLESMGIESLATPGLSQIDRIRLIADYIYRAFDTPEHLVYSERSDEDESS